MNPSDSSPPGSERAVLTPLERPRGLRIEHILGSLLIIGILGAAWFLRDSWLPDSILYPRLEQAPNGLSWLRFSTTRRELLQQMSAEGVLWSHLDSPGMGLNPWASHVGVRLQGQDRGGFAVMFSDGARYNYRAIPKDRAGVLDAAKLETPGSETATIVAIRWTTPRGFTERNSPVVARSVLRDLGQPHEETKDPQSSGRLFIWNWPGVRGTFQSEMGILSLQQTEPVEKLNEQARKQAESPR